MYNKNMEVGQGSVLLLTADTIHQHRLAGGHGVAQHWGTWHAEGHRAAHTVQPTPSRLCCAPGRGERQVQQKFQEVPVAQM